VTEKDVPEHQRETGTAVFIAEEEG
jgi:hypothetical protein